jgi:hypothetical protein
MAEAQRAAQCAASDAGAAHPQARSPRSWGTPTAWPRPAPLPIFTPLLERVDAWEVPVRLYIYSKPARGGRAAGQGGLHPAGELQVYDAGGRGRGRRRRGRQLRWLDGRGWRGVYCKKGAVQQEWAANWKAARSENNVEVASVWPSRRT